LKTNHLATPVPHETVANNDKNAKMPPTLSMKYAKNFNGTMSMKIIQRPTMSMGNLLKIVTDIVDENYTETDNVDEKYAKNYI
jgi:hypothetical protein